MPDAIPAETTVLQAVFFQGKQVRPVSRDGDVWFVGRDVCEVLAIKDASKALERLDADEKGTAIGPTLGGDQNLTIISEAGAYRLIFTSRRPEAETVKRWLAHEVIPAIRRTGGYAATRAPTSRAASKADDRDAARQARRIRHAKFSLVESAMRLDALGVNVASIDIATVLDFGRRLKAIGARP